MLVAPGVSFNVPYRNHFRVTTLPDAAQLKVVFTRIEELLASYAAHPAADGAHKVLSARDRFAKT